MTEFLAFARHFEETSRHPINLFDLGIALLLEDFAGPLLALTRYAPLRERRLLGPLDPEVKNVLAGVDVDAVDEESLILIGQGLSHRYQTMLRANRLALLARGVVLVVYTTLSMAIILAPSMLRAAAILGGWLFAIALAMVACRCNWHWRPRGAPGLRRDPG